MTYYILTYIKYYAILTHRVQTKVTRRGTPPWVYFFGWLFCYLRKEGDEFGSYKRTAGGQR